MEHPVVLEADWFRINGCCFIKRLAYYAPSLGKSGQYTFTLPSSAGFHCKSLEQQAQQSHGLQWNETGSRKYHQIGGVFKQIFRDLRKHRSQLSYYAKGEQKCSIFEQYVATVRNLEFRGCPTYENLSSLPKTTLTKAVVFGSWIMESGSPTLSRPQLWKAL